MVQYSEEKLCSYHGDSVNTVVTIVTTVAKSFPIFLFVGPEEELLGGKPHDQEFVWKTCGWEAKNPPKTSYRLTVGAKA